MSSITVSDLMVILKHCDPNWEVVMNIKHKYPISKEQGEKGWLAYINGYQIDKDFGEVRLLN